MNAVDFTKYDEIASQYSSYIDNKSWNKLYERPYMISFLKNIKNKYIVDAACGSGFYSKYCIDNGAYVIAIDASEKMIEITRTKVSSNRFKAYVADLSKPIKLIETETQDIIISSLTLHYIDDISIPLSEYYRILKKNGTVLISMHHPFNDYLYLKKESYFSSGIVEDTWKGFGEPMKVCYFTKPLGALLQPFLDSEFKILAIDEPLPNEECKNEVPEEYKRLCKEPAFLFIRLLKK